MELQILFQESANDIVLGETLEVTPFGDNLFRLEHSSLFHEGIYYGDIVELTHQEDTTWRFIRVADYSGWHHYSYILSKVLVQSELFRLWLESVIERGGFWEIAYGGVVFIHYPPDAQIEVPVELQELIAKAT